MNIDGRQHHCGGWCPGGHTDDIDPFAEARHDCGTVVCDSCELHIGDDEVGALRGRIVVCRECGADEERAS